MPATRLSVRRAVSAVPSWPWKASEAAFEPGGPWKTAMSVPWPAPNSVARRSLTVVDSDVGSSQPPALSTDAALPATLVAIAVAEAVDEGTPAAEHRASFLELRP